MYHAGLVRQTTYQNLSTIHSATIISSLHQLMRYTLVILQIPAATLKYPGTAGGTASAPCSRRHFKGRSSVGQGLWQTALADCADLRGGDAGQDGSGSTQVGGKMGGCTETEGLGLAYPDA